jgi:hypothetical protein
MSIATLRELSASENDDVLTEMLTVGLDRSVNGSLCVRADGIFLSFGLMAFT